MFKRFLIISLTLFLTLFLNSCASVPKGVEVVSDFEVTRYLGKWYEIARLDHSFERGLSKVTADYSMNEDGSLLVLNRGYQTKTMKWQEAQGKAKFTGSSDEGSLKVSFFGPFYGGYNIIALDKQNYKHVMIVGNDRNYLWILSRTAQLDPTIKQQLLNQAKALNFPVKKLIMVDHSLASTQ